MGFLFNRKPKTATGYIDDKGFHRLHEPTLDEASDELKLNAIEYIVSLNKADKDKFFAGVELIWQGYQGIDSVQTKHQRALHREAKQAGFDDDPELAELLIDTPQAPKTVGKAKEEATNNAKAS